MIIDPHIAVIRISADDGPALYDAVMQRIAGRADQPQGVLMHYSGVRGGEFLVGTVFRDQAAMFEGFVSFSALESQNVMIETGRAMDLTRDEYPLIRLYVEEGIESHPFSMVPAGGIAASTSDVLKMTPEDYRRLGEETGWFESPIPGRIAHLAYASGEHVTTVEFWESQSAGEQAYRARAHAAYERHHPGELTEQKRVSTWFGLHSFLVSAPAGDPVRGFLREVEGPTTI